MDDGLNYETIHLLKTVHFALCLRPTSGLSHVSAFRADIHHKATETAFPNSVRHSLTHCVKNKTCQCLFLLLFLYKAYIVYFLTQFIILRDLPEDHQKVTAECIS